MTQLEHETTTPSRHDTVPPSSESAEGAWIRVGTLAELRQAGHIVVRGADRPIAVFAHDGKVSAVDNRCPHLGFPLDTGSVRDGILTCHWHQARFDLCSGCTFDLWADDAPAFETRTDAGVVFVRSLPRRNAGAARRQLLKGLSQNQPLLQAKGLVGMLAEKAPYVDLIRDILQFGVAHQNGGAGLTELAIGANLAQQLSPDARYAMLFRGSQQIAAAAANSRRQFREPLTPGDHPFATLNRWFSQWVLVRDQDAAERVLLTAISGGASPAQLGEMLCGADSQRVYNAQGHSFDLTNKAMELLNHVGWNFAAQVLPLTLPNMISGRGAEEDGRWRQPVDLIALIRAVEERLPKLLAGTRAADWTADPGLPAVLLGEDPAAIVAALADALAAGAPPEALSAHVAHAAAMRLARFSTGNEVGDWFNPQHTFTYANAVDQAIRRSPVPQVVRALFHAAMALYMDRYLNIPPAKLPDEAGSLDDLPADAATLKKQILEALDGRSMVHKAARLVARYLALNHPMATLTDLLAQATLREDLDFHTLQVLEAGVRQAAHWPDRFEATPVFIGVIRNLAAVCPTPRARLKVATTALRLHRGEQMYAAD